MLSLQTLHLRLSLSTPPEARSIWLISHCPVSVRLALGQVYHTFLDQPRIYLCNSLAGLGGSALWARFGSIENKWMKNRETKEDPGAPCVVSCRGPKRFSAAYFCVIL
jgi:hypothetical protein